MSTRRIGRPSAVTSVKGDFLPVAEQERIPPIFSPQQSSNLHEYMQELHSNAINLIPAWSVSSRSQLSGRLRIDLQIHHSFGLGAECEQIQDKQFLIRFPVGIALRTYVLLRLTLRYWTREPLPLFHDMPNQEKIPPALQVLFASHLAADEFCIQLTDLNSTISANDRADVDAFSITLLILRWTYLHEVTHILYQHHFALARFSSIPESVKQAAQQMRRQRIQEDAQLYAQAASVDPSEKLGPQPIPDKYLTLSEKQHDFDSAASIVELLNNKQVEPPGWSPNLFRRGIEYWADHFAASVMAASMCSPLNPKSADEFSLQFMKFVYAVFLRTCMIHANEILDGRQSGQGAEYGHPFWRCWITLTYFANAIECQDDSGQLGRIWNDARLATCIKASDALRHLGIEFAGDQRAILSGFSLLNDAEQFREVTHGYQREWDIAKYTEELLLQTGLLRT